MSRRLKTDIPGIDWRVSLDEAGERGFAKIFAGRVAHPLPLVVRIATDDPDYAEWIDTELAATPALVNCCAPDRWRASVPDRMPTAYELEWRALGRSFHFFEYERRA